MPYIEASEFGATALLGAAADCTKVFAEVLVRLIITPATTKSIGNATSHGSRAIAMSRAPYSVAAVAQIFRRSRG